jgi:hypothetical protein
MKKVLLVVLLLLGMAVILHAQDSGDDGESDTEKNVSDKLGGSVRIGYSFPFFCIMLTNYNESNDGDDLNSFMHVLLAFAFSSVSVGGGVQYTVVPHLLAPGLYLDMQFNLLSWAIMGIAKREFIIFQGGIRLYNQFGFSVISLEPFFGFNFIYLKMDELRMPLPLMAAGFVFNIARFSIEYGYHFYPRRVEGGHLLGLHRFTLSGIVWKK